MISVNHCRLKPPDVRAISRQRARPLCIDIIITIKIVLPILPAVYYCVKLKLVVQRIQILICFINIKHF